MTVTFGVAAFVSIVWLTLVVGLVIGWLLRGGMNTAVRSTAIDLTGARPRPPATADTGKRGYP